MQWPFHLTSLSEPGNNWPPSQPVRLSPPRPDVQRRCCWLEREGTRTENRECAATGEPIPEPPPYSFAFIIIQMRSRSGNGRDLSIRCVRIGEEFHIKVINFFYRNAAPPTVTHSLGISLIDRLVPRISGPEPASQRWKVVWWMEKWSKR